MPRRRFREGGKTAGTADLKSQHRMRGARRFDDRRFHVRVLARGRRDRRGKSGGPTSLKLSSEVERNNVHGHTSAYLVAQIPSRQRGRPEKGPASDSALRAQEAR